jgi:phosphonate transport system substrate-binding protein
MIESGKVKPNANKILWTSAPLPNDAIAVPKGTSQAFIDQVQKILTSITVEQAKTLLPPHYTGFVKADHAAYESIEKAGIAVGKIKRKA